MNYGECLAMIKMNKYAKTFGESADTSTYEKFFSIQNEFLNSYATYLEKIENMISKIGEDVELRVVTKVPVINPDNLIKFEREWNEVCGYSVEENKSTVIPESSFEIEDRVAKEPPYVEVNNLKDYLHHYSIFVEFMVELGKTIKNKISYLQDKLIELDKFTSGMKLPGKIEWYLNVLSTLRVYLIKYVEYGEALKNTIDDD